MRKATATALFALALGGFGLGLTEFVTFGLLPEIAHGIVPGLATTDYDQALSRTGWSISAYALGVVVGAPTLAILGARLPRLRLLGGLLIALAVFNAASAFAPNLPLLLLARFAAGLPHGAYFGVAGLLAANLLGPGARARGFALVLSGLTVANVIGVPVITRVGQTAGWRTAYAAVALVFLIAWVLATFTVRDTAEQSDSTPRTELGALRSPAVWLAISVAAIGSAGFFAADSYLAPVTTHSAGLADSTVPWVLAVVGLGMTVGNIAGGIAADRHPTVSLLGGLVALTLVMVAFAVFAKYPVGLFVTAFGLGATALFLAPALQTQLVRAAPRAVLIGPALNQSAMNVANSLGAVAGGAVISHDFAYTATGWIGAVLALAGLALALVALRALRASPDPEGQLDQAAPAQMR